MSQLHLLRKKGFQMTKSFILDTNVLLHNAAALTAFADNEVVIPIDVLEEIDNFKKESNELGRNARAAIRKMDELRVKGHLKDGVPIDETGGTLRVAFSSEEGAAPMLRADTADNRIISVAYESMKSGRPTIFVSKDINARIRADSLGINAMDFEKQKVDFDRLYSGWAEIEFSAGQIAELNEKGQIAVEGEFLPNQFLVMKEKGQSEKEVMARYAGEGKAVALEYDGGAVYGIRPRNVQQTMAMELLLLEEVRLVTLVGQAGTGKTLIALACALHKCLRERSYKKVLVSRPIIPMGRDIGYLPGSKEEKLEHWMEPIFDNLELIMYGKSRDKNKDRKSKDDDRGSPLERLFETDKVALEALTYIRGRSIPDQFMLVDEAQNLTPHEVKTVISRAGDGTKVVLTGDPYQIDNPYLDATSNGLTYAADRMKGEKLVGHVTLLTSERSELASLAASRL
jgi:PhoH-like ATPase